MGAKRVRKLFYDIPYKFLSLYLVGNFEGVKKPNFELFGRSTCTKMMFSLSGYYVIMSLTIISDSYTTKVIKNGQPNWNIIFTKEVKLGPFFSFKTVVGHHESHLSRV